MIPAEIATRLQLLLPEELLPVDRIRPLPSDLPLLDKGARFMAQILGALPDGTYRALVAGKQLTLALPEGAKTGDVLELIVTGRQAQSITAQMAPPTALAQAGTSSTPASISQTGQLISQLLTGRHSTGQTVPLNANQPLVSAPPQSAAALLPALRNAVAQSGLFYESHQAQWVAGKLPLAVLQQEPQAHTPPLLGGSAEGNTAAPPPLRASLPGLNQPADALRSNALGSGINTTDDSAATDALQSKPRIAESLMPMVHQQLDTLATQQASWQGFAWPGQMMHWEIESPPPEHGDTPHGEGDDESAVWQSTLRLQMPMLGDLEAKLIITAAGVAIRLNAATPEAVARLESGKQGLGDALAAAGVELTGFMVAQDGHDA